MAMLKGKTPLVVAVVLGVIAGAIAYGAVRRKEREVKAGWALVPVIVATQDLAEGTVVTFEMVSQRPVPEQFVTSSVVKPDSASYVVGQKVLVPVQAGDLLLWSQFESSKAAERLSSMVLTRARAVSIDVSGAKMTVAGWIRPNDHVDIIGSFRDPVTGEQMARTLMQNVLVVATGKLTGSTNINLVQESDRGYESLSLLLLPEEAEILSLATDLGSLTLTLRNPIDIEVAPPRAHATLATLLSGERTQELLATRKTVIEEIRGAERSKVSASQGRE
jgi:pilus assembly protein CpaB